MLDPELKRAVEVILTRFTAPAPQVEDTWMGIPKACKYADVSPDTIRRAIGNGRLKAYGEGKLTRLRRSDVDRWLEGLNTPDATAITAANILAKLGKR